MSWLSELEQSLFGSIGVDQAYLMFNSSLPYNCCGLFYFLLTMSIRFRQKKKTKSIQTSELQ